MKIKDKPPLPNVARLRIDDEEFDAIRLKNGDFRVAEVVLSEMCTHGDLVRADEAGRVTAVVRRRYETLAFRCASEEQLAATLAMRVEDGVAHRVVLGDTVLSAEPLDEDIEPSLGADTDEAEWNYAWSRIYGEFGDFDCENEGECWQYMESYEDRDGWRHSFRHRDLPGSEGYTRRAYPASKGWSPRRPAPRGRMRCATLDRSGVAIVPEDGTVGTYVVLSALDSVRMRRYVLDEHGPEAERAAFRHGGWPERLVEEMLAATLTEDSARRVEFLDR